MDILMLITTFCWAGNIIAGKMALRGMSALALAQTRVIAATLVFGAMFLLARRARPLRIARREWGVLALTAFFGITVNQLFFIAGIGRTSAAHSGLIVALGPVMVLILSCALRLEPLTVLKALGAVISLAGVGLLTSGKAAHASGATWQGDALLLVAGAAFAYYTILLKEIADRFDSLSLNTLLFGMGAGFMLPIGAGAIRHVSWATFTSEAWWSIVFMVALGTVAAYLIYAFALTELTASRVAAFAYLQPVIASLLGIWLLGESPNSRVVAGGGLILFGVYLAERERGDEFQGAVPARRGESHRM
jgi:drug/metabolite transporter (DMT)-like permease